MPRRATPIPRWLRALAICCGRSRCAGRGPTTRPRFGRSFAHYGEQDEEDRKRALAQLNDLPGGEGTAGLCRIARFDRSPLISRLAALVIILPADHDDSDRSIDPEVISRELGPSASTGGDVAAAISDSIARSGASVAGWQKLVDQEMKRLGSNADETSPRIATDLLWNLADVYRRLGDTPQLLGVVDRMMSIGGDESDDTLATTLKWFVDHESWGALDQFATKYESRIQQTKTSLYLLALARAQAGAKGCGGATGGAGVASRTEAAAGEPRPRASS